MVIVGRYRDQGICSHRIIYSETNQFKIFRSLRHLMFVKSRGFSTARINLYLYFT